MLTISSPTQESIEKEEKKTEEKDEEESGDERELTLYTLMLSTVDKNSPHPYSRIRTLTPNKSGAKLILISEVKAYISKFLEGWTSDEYDVPKLREFILNIDWTVKHNHEFVMEEYEEENFTFGFRSSIDDDGIWYVAIAIDDDDHDFFEYHTWQIEEYDVE